MEELKDEKPTVDVPTCRKPEIVYESKYYTVARAYNLFVDLSNGKSREIVAEGIARRSWRDAYSQERGRQIAIGRAVKAMKKKICNERCHHPLMNG